MLREAIHRAKDNPHQGMLREAGNSAENSEHKNILLFSFLIPPLIISFVRNYFDTYFIGLIIFHISSSVIFFWEIAILMFLNLVCIAHYKKYNLNIFISLNFIIYLFYFISYIIC
jgi:predicted membrane protein